MDWVPTKCLPINSKSLVACCFPGSGWPAAARWLAPPWAAPQWPRRPWLLVAPWALLLVVAPAPPAVQPKPPSMWHRRNCRDASGFLESLFFLRCIWCLVWDVWVFSCAGLVSNGSTNSKVVSQRRGCLSGIIWCHCGPDTNLSPSGWSEMLGKKLHNNVRKQGLRKMNSIVSSFFTYHWCFSLFKTDVEFADLRKSSRPVVQSFHKLYLCLQSQQYQSSKGVTYVQNVVLAPGDCVADPSTDPRLDGNPRRLQQAMSADYVVVFPAALGLEVLAGWFFFGEIWDVFFWEGLRSWWCKVFFRLLSWFFPSHLDDLCRAICMFVIEKRGAQSTLRVFCSPKRMV